MACLYFFFLKKPLFTKNYRVTVLKKVITLTLVYSKFQGKTKERETEVYVKGVTGRAGTLLKMMPTVETM